MTAPTILIAEDEMIIAMDLKDTLEGAGFQTEGPYATMAGAMKAIEAATPACAILDVRLMDEDIYPLADELIRRGIPFIFHTGHGKPTDILARYPAAIFCLKPSRPESVVAAVSLATAAA
ncbi:response regulator [Falsirhodobacter halotolerans]|uniref:response regulator n=1 Tax=Falsirhodobacter halotolerans TaxID=1146892 RepID=UPI001FD01550|nr:response regulator [Falsirhodobacter halotolerans]MCJ8138455.1 response regulator [Falsirhodobacter halotolerans]